MQNIFAMGQMLAAMDTMQDNTVIKARKDLNRIVELFKNRPDYMELVTDFALSYRYLNVETFLNADSFMVQPDVLISEIPEDLRHVSLGFCKGMDIIFAGRFVYPVKDVRGDVMGWCGYDNESSTKYLDSINYGYVAKRYSLWGMEELPKYYRSTEPVYFVEGIVCALYLRQCGCQALAMLGSNVSPYVFEIMRRFGERAVVIVDADEAGLKCKMNLRRKSRTIRVYQSRVAKDIDDSRQVDPDFINEVKALRDPFYVSTKIK